MRITIAICTRNRASALSETLTSIGRNIYGVDAEVSVLVVDNGSTDDTARVLEQHAVTLPLRTIVEPAPGASHARNRVLDEADGDYIVWTDDDVLVQKGWLQAYIAAFSRWPQASFFGGAIEPLFLGSPPRWLLKSLPHLGGVYAVREFGSEPAPLTWDRTPFGANMAMRREEQARYRYDTRLGPAPGRAFGGEETDLVRRMMADGHTGWWVPDARVQHVIPEPRQSTTYIAAYYRGYGVQLIAQPAPGRHVLGRPAWAIRQVVVAEAEYRIARLLRGPEVWVRKLVDASVARGMLEGAALRSSHAPMK